jgi:SH3 domain-containing YSC84-like protein 1
MRRALWADDEANSTCSKCRSPFSYAVYKHHCRKCGLIFCNECSRSKLLIPAEELVLRPPENWLTKVQSSLPSAVVNDEDGFRAPKRVCDGCSHQLRGLQEDLRILVSRANQETIINSSSIIPGVPQIDYFLENEIRNATMLLHNLRTTSGEENIPKELLALAKGVVFMTIIKAGFMFTGRYGTGIVVAKVNYFSVDSSLSPRRSHNIRRHQQKLCINYGCFNYSSVC